MILSLAAVAALLGFAWLALAMDVHWRQVRGGVDAPHALRIVLRALGGIALAVSALLCFLANRPSMAVLVWVMLLAAAAMLVALTLAWGPRLLRAAWPWGRG